MKPLADEVAAARGLEFEKAVTVTPLPFAEYAARLGASTIDGAASKAPAWRALGLLNGELDVAAVGLQAINDAPAFYDSATKTILVSDDLAAQAHLYRFAMHRALTAALLDQRFEWSTRVATASPASAFAIRATIDADALAVANKLAAADQPEALSTEVSAYSQGHVAAVASSPYASAVAGRAGAALRPLAESKSQDSTALAAFEQASPNSDSLFDVAHPVATVASPAGTQGMMFWYYVLASRIDDAQAWAAATRWSGDSLAAPTGTTSGCVDATIAAADPEGAAVLLLAFTSWATTAPAESTTTVAPIDGNQVEIKACDPGAAVAATIPTKVPVAFGAAGVEHALVQAAVAGAIGSTIDAACLVNAARQRPLVLTSPADDAPVIAVGWQPAYVAANIDLAASCTAVPAG
jgi:hypothetical protein